MVYLRLLTGGIKAARTGTATLCAVVDWVGIPIQLMGAEGHCSMSLRHVRPGAAEPWKLQNPPWRISMADVRSDESYETRELPRSLFCAHCAMFLQDHDTHSAYDSSLMTGKERND